MGNYTMIIYLVVIVAVFYFLMIRPERKKKKKLEEMRASLVVGSRIVTIGGLTGTIVGLEDDRVTFETSEDRVRVEVMKWAISTAENTASSYSEN